METEWRPLANCLGTDTELFYKQEMARGIPVSERAISLCLTCPVIEPCLQYALDHEDYGYWAGTTSRERRAMRIKLKITLRRPEVRLSIPTTDGEEE